MERSLFRRAVTAGLVAGVAAIYFGAMGIIAEFHERAVISEGSYNLGLSISLPEVTLSYVLLLTIFLVSGFVVTSRGRRALEPVEYSAGQTLMSGAVAGALGGVLLTLFLLLMNTFELRETFLNIRQELFDILTFNSGLTFGIIVWILGGALIGLLGAALHLLRPEIRRPILAGLTAVMFVSLMEPLIANILDDLNEEVFAVYRLDITEDWLYKGEGLTLIGLLVVFAIGAGIALARERQRRDAAETEPAVVADSKGREPAAPDKRPVTTGDAPPAALRKLSTWGALALLALELLVLMAIIPIVQPVELLLIVVFLVAAAWLMITKGFDLRLLLIIGGLLLLPQVAGSFPSQIIGQVGVYVLLGLGLNIVVGYAGMLDLGYVAFFGIGAYLTGVLTCTGVCQNDLAFTPGLNFWVALPIIVAVTAMAGVIIGAPVLRLRGDYLAIVTLGFGEIIRVIVQSDWAKPALGGAQGLKGTPAPDVFGQSLREPEAIYYLILALCLLVAFIAYRMKYSRLGRAWNAMREDEQVAEAMGISIIKTKLLAFALGAALGSFSGAIFAIKIGSIFPSSVQLLVSINVLAIIVLGGMGSIPGVVVGSFVLVGIPEVLRQFEEYRLLFYGAILMAIMILRPEGLIPDVRRQRELREVEDDDSQFSHRAGADTGAPTVMPAGAGEAMS